MSDVVATILLLGLTVTLFAAIFAFVTTFPSPVPQNNDQFQASLVTTSNLTYVTQLHILHLAGPAVSGTAQIYLKSANHPLAPEFQSYYPVSAGIGGASSWNLGQVWNLTFPTTERPVLPDNITIYIVASSQLIFSVILPGTTVAPPPTVASTAISPATPTVGTIYTVYATITGAYTSNSVYVNLAAVPGAPSTAQKMTLNAQGVWTYTVPSGATTNGTFYGFVNASNGAGQQSTGLVVVTIYPSSTNTNGPLSVGVILVPAPPNSGVTESVQAVVTYTGTSSGAALSVSFSGSSSPSGYAYSGTGPSGLTISGPASVTVVSQSTWTIPAPNTLYAYTVSATATVGALAPVTGTMTFTPALLTASTASFAVGSTTPTATGQAFAPATGVNLTLAGVAVTPTFTASTGTCPELGTSGAILTSSTGGFTCAFTVPLETTHGALSLVATDSRSGQVDSTTFTVTQSTFTLSPTSGDVGGTTTATGTAFGYTKTITFTLDGASAASSCTSTGTGTFSCSVTIPAVPAGLQTMVASDGTDSGTATYTVYLDPTVAVTPATTVYYDIGQTATALTATTTYSGPNTAALAWYSGSSLTCSSDATSTGITTATYTPTITTAGTTDYCVRVTDSGVSGYTGYSNVVTVTVNTALTAPATPTASTVSHAFENITGVIPTTGTPTYSWTWMVSLSGAAYVAATQCAVNSGSGASGGATVTCQASGLLTSKTYAWELKVTDSATTATSATSTATTAQTGGPASPLGSAEHSPAGVESTRNSAALPVAYSIEGMSTAHSTSGPVAGSLRDVQATATTLAAARSPVVNSSRSR